MGERMKVRSLFTLATASVVAVTLLGPANAAIASENTTEDPSRTQESTQAGTNSANSLASVVEAATDPNLEAFDVSASATSSGLIAKSGSVEVKIPVDATEPVSSTLATEEGEVTISVGTGASDESRGVLAADGTVVYDAPSSTSHTVQPTIEGFRIHSVIEDESASTEVAHDVHLPEGAKLVPAEDMPQTEDAPAPAGAVFVVGANGSTIGAFMSPWAKDANGNDVATRYEINAGKLVQLVEHNVPGTAYPVVADPQFGWAGWFPVVQFNRAETAASTTAVGVLKVCGRIARGLPVGLAACAISAVQISIQAVIANARRECIQLAPAPIGAMAFRYTGGYCR